MKHTSRQNSLNLKKKPKRVDLREFVHTLLSNNSSCVRKRDHNTFEIKWNEFLELYKFNFGSSIELKNLKNMLTRKKNGFKIKKELSSEGYDAVVENLFLSDFVSINNHESNMYRDYKEFGNNTLYDILEKTSTIEDTLTDDPTSPASFSDTSMSDINEENLNVILANETKELPLIEQKKENISSLKDLSDIQNEDLKNSGACHYYHGKMFSKKDSEVILIQSYLAMDHMPCYLIRTSLTSHLTDQDVFIFSVIEKNIVKDFQITHFKIERNNKSYLVIRKGTNYPSLKDALENLKPTNQAFPVPSSIFRRTNMDKFEQ